LQVLSASLVAGLHARSQEESLALLLLLEVQHNCSALAKMVRQLDDPNNTDWVQGKGDPGSLTHKDWDAQSAHLMRVLAGDPLTLAALENAYRYLSCVPVMQLPENVTTGSRRFQWSGWVGEAVRNMKALFDDANPHLRKTCDRLSTRTFLDRIKESFNPR
jgi:hypothetical protein